MSLHLGSRVECLTEFLGQSVSIGFVFYQRDIFGPEVRSMTLEITRSGVTFRYQWNFTDEEGGTHVALRDQ